VREALAKTSPLKSPSSAFGTFIRAIHGANPSGGFAVQIGNPADLSPASGRRESGGLTIREGRDTLRR
jgi:hypothetical protein